MKPAPFAYHAPESLDEVLALLASGGDVRVLAGGQSLVPMMKARALKPTAVIDVNRVPGLAFVEEEGGAVQIGALTRQQALLDDDVAGREQPLLRAAGRFAGYLATRHRGTVGGSLAFAAPWAELTAAVVALDAQLEIRSARGERTVAARCVLPRPARDGTRGRRIAGRRCTCRLRRREPEPGSTRSAPGIATSPRSRPRRR